MYDANEPEILAGEKYESHETDISDNTVYLQTRRAELRKVQGKVGELERRAGVECGVSAGYCAAGAVAYFGFDIPVPESAAAGWLFAWAGAAVAFGLSHYWGKKAQYGRQRVDEITAKINACEGDLQKKVEE